MKGIPPGYLSIFYSDRAQSYVRLSLDVKESEVVESGLKVDEAV